MDAALDIAGIGQDIPHLLDRAALDALLIRAYQKHVSDICIQTGEPIIVSHYGRHHSVTKRTMGESELNQIVGFMYGSAGIARLGSGEDLDFSHEVKISRHERIRFRVNVSAGRSENGDGLQMSLRTIPSTPIPLASMRLTPDILRGLFPDQGLVLIAGATGSGKTTLLASTVRQLLEQRDNEKVLTVESPIEFVHKGTYSWRSGNVCMQSEVGRHTMSFASFVRGTLRRAPTTVMVGEMRDKETFGAGLELGLAGARVYGTTHAKGVSETLRRVLTVFNADERAGRMTDLLESLKMVLVQRLIPSSDGKQIAAREYLVFDDAVKGELYRAAAQSVEHLALRTRELTKERGETLLKSVTRFADEGLIERRWVDVIALEAKMNIAVDQGMG